MNRRERQHDNIREEVKTIARQHMAAQGTAALSLRAIARDMELSAPALYRYFPSRDDLITALIIDAFRSQAAMLHKAVQGVPEHDPLGRMAAFMLAYRDWALTNRVDFQLIYGNPIPDYHAPAEITSPEAQHSMSAGVIAFQGAISAGALVPPPEYATIPPELCANIIDQSALYDSAVSPIALYLGMMAWGLGHGLVMLELFGHLQPTISDTAAFYRLQVEDLIRRMGGVRGSP